MTEDLIQSLTKLQSMAVKMYAQSHGYHWNITGRMFKQDHAFLLEIYQDVFDSIDPISENLRKLGAKAPFGTKNWDSNSELTINDSPDLDSIQMFKELNLTNTIILAMLKRVFDQANEIDEQGICNFIAERIDQHQFWQWQLTATLK